MARDPSGGRGTIDDGGDRREVRALRAARRVGDAFFGGAILFSIPLLVSALVSPAARAGAGGVDSDVAVVTVDEVRAFACTLPRSSEAFVRGRVKFRIGRIVWLAFSRDGSTMGFAFPKELRQALVDSDPEKFSLPGSGDLRYHWAHVRLDAIDSEEMRELVEDAWAFCAPRRVAEECAAASGETPSRPGRGARLL